MYYDYELKMIANNPQLGLLHVHDDVCDLTPLLEMDVSVEELDSYLGWIDQLLKKSEGYLLDSKRISLLFHEVHLDPKGDLKLKYMEIGKENLLTIDDFRTYHRGHHMALKGEERRKPKFTKFNKSLIGPFILFLILVLILYYSQFLGVLSVLMVIVSFIVYKFKPYQRFSNSTMILASTNAHIKGIGHIKDVHGVIDKIIIGRLSKCDVCIDEPYIGKKHAVIAKEKNVCHIQDLNSKNGTYVNGIKLKGKSKRKLLNGDVIKIGSYEFEFVQ